MAESDLTKPNINVHHYTIVDQLYRVRDFKTEGSKFSKEKKICG
jgi:hypothetical protein